MTNMITPKELAERWDVTEAHLANMRAKGKHPYMKVRGRVYYNVDDILLMEQVEYHDNRN